MTGVPPTQPGLTGGNGGGAGSGAGGGGGGAGSSGPFARLLGGGAGKGGGTGGTGPTGGRGPSQWQRRKPLLEPVLVLAIGLALGVVDIMAAEVAGLFRVVAIVAGLVLAGHGMTQFELIRAAEEARAARTAQADQPAEGSGTAPGAGVPATSNAAPSTVNRGVDADAGEDNPGSRAVSLTLGLAVLLAVLAIMNPTAPPTLVLLSLLAAYMLFAHGWRQLSARS